MSSVIRPINKGPNCSNCPAYEPFSAPAGQCPLARAQIGSAVLATIEGSTMNSKSSKNSGQGQGASPAQKLENEVQGCRGVKKSREGAMRTNAQGYSSYMFPYHADDDRSPTSDETLARKVESGIRAFTDLSLPEQV